MDCDLNLAVRKVDDVVALLLLAHSRRCCGASLDNKDAPCPGNEFARILARGVMMVPCKNHIDTCTVDCFEREILPADRTLDIASDLHRKQWVVSNKDAHCTRCCTRERLADESHLVLVDPAILECQRSRGVDSKYCDPLQFDKRAQAFIDKAAVAREW